MDEFVPKLAPLTKCTSVIYYGFSICLFIHWMGSQVGRYIYFMLVCILIFIFIFILVSLFGIRFAAVSQSHRLNGESIEYNDWNGYAASALFSSKTWPPDSQHNSIEYRNAGFCFFIFFLTLYRTLHHRIHENRIGIAIAIAIVMVYFASLH